jgi:O-antigen ligase
MTTSRGKIWEKPWFDHTKESLRSELLLPLAIGLWSAAIAAAPGATLKALLLAPAILAGVVWWTILRPQRWLILFFVCLLLTPPLPIPLGDSGVHTAPLFAALGLLAGALRMKQWRSLVSPLPLAFLAFVAVLVMSLSFAALYSGVDLALHSLLRVGLFAVSVYVFAWALAGPRASGADPIRFARFLYIVAILAGLFACADFYFQFPAPAGFEQQFVWLDDGVLRRAQGLFYEASTLGNFCAFFLVMTVVAFFRPRHESPCPGNESPCSRPVLAAGGLIFAAALIFSYSRASMIAVIVACITLAFLRRARLGRVLLGASIALVVAAVIVQLALPSFATNYWNRIDTSFQEILVTPDRVFTGRLATWSVLLNFLAARPWHAIFGIGYKTLPYTSFAGAPVVADNTYLSLLVETGLIGLSTFLVLNFLILRGGLRAARSRFSRASFLGEWIFCFWVGEIVQMMSGDLVTYWRVLPVYFWVLGTAIRETSRAPE